MRKISKFKVCACVVLDNQPENFVLGEAPRLKLYHGSKVASYIYSYMRKWKMQHVDQES